jgi:2-oxoglutarate dehydrogenase E1 component
MQRLTNANRHVPRLLTNQYARCLSSYHVTSRKLHSSNTKRQESQSSYAQAMYEEWQRNPQSVDAAWGKYFESGGVPAKAESSRSSSQPTSIFYPAASARLPNLPDAVPLDSSEDITDHMKIQLLVRAYQARGHHIAKLDPLGILDPDLDPNTPSELKLSHYGFTENDLGKKFTLGPESLPDLGSTKLTLREIIDHLKKVYCK